jgi:hypothetical protein
MSWIGLERQKPVEDGAGGNAKSISDPDLTIQVSLEDEGANRRQDPTFVAHMSALQPMTTQGIREENHNGFVRITSSIM